MICCATNGNVIVDAEFSRVVEAFTLNRLNSLFLINDALSKKTPQECLLLAELHGREGAAFRGSGWGGAGTGGSGWGGPPKERVQALRWGEHL